MKDSIKVYFLVNQIFDYTFKRRYVYEHTLTLLMIALKFQFLPSNFQISQRCKVDGLLLNCFFCDVAGNVILTLWLLKSYNPS
jgi:hypothetical protein